MQPVLGMSGARVDASRFKISHDDQIVVRLIIIISSAGAPVFNARDWEEGLPSAVDPISMRRML